MNSSTATSSANGLAVAMIVIELLALVMNILSIYLVSKQGFRQLDMWFATIMTSCDTAVVIFKLIEYIYMKYGDPTLIFNHQYGQYEGILQIYIIQLSTSCVGMLALLRFWVIFLRRSINTKRWVISFIVFELLLLVILFVVAGRGGMALVANKRFYYPDVTSKDGLIIFTRYWLVLYSFLSILAVNVCYPCIAWRYIFDLRHFSAERGIRSHVEAQELRTQKIMVLFKIFIMVLIYDVIMLSYFYYCVVQLIRNEPNPAADDNIIGMLMIILTLVNPLMLLTLHYETWRELKSILYRFYRKLVRPQQPLPTKDGFILQSNHSDVALTSLKPVTSPV